VILALMKRDPAARPNATAARWLLTVACSAYGAGISTSAQADGGAQGAAGVARAGAQAGTDVSGAGAQAGVGGRGVGGGVRGARTPLQTFASQADHRTVAWLIAHGAEVNARSHGGRTAAHFAAERNTGPKTLAVLAENGADLSARDGDGLTPLEIARLNEKPRLVEWIARRGATTPAWRTSTPET